MKKNQRAVIYTARAAAVPPVPNYPYRVVWNFIESAKNDAQFLHTGKPAPYTAEIDAFAVLTNNPPLPFTPTMRMGNNFPYTNELLGNAPTVMHRRQEPALRVDRIAEIITPVRDFQSAIFQLRFGVTGGVFNSVNLMRYNLNADGTRYIMLSVENDAGTLRGQIRQNLTGINEGSTIFEMGSFAEDSNNTDYRLAISPTHVSVLISNPGTEMQKVPLAGTVKVEPGAHFLIFEDADMTDNPPVVAHMHLDGFIAYEGLI
jgi:hypothetical protein